MSEDALAAFTEGEPIDEQQQAEQTLLAELELIDVSDDHLVKKIPKAELTERRRLLDRNLDRTLAAIADRKAKIAANRAIHEDRVARSTMWLAQANRQLEHDLRFLEAVLEGNWQMYPLDKNERSRSLPGGRVGWRATQGRLVVLDMEAAVAFARENDIPVKEEVKISELKTWLKGEDIDTETGEITEREIPGFATLEGGDDAFYYDARQ